MSSAIGGNLGTVAASRALIRCPHCLAPAIIRTSTQVTVTIKDLHMICLNPDCGHTWKAQIAPVHTISPSQLPNPDVHIPPCPPEYIRHRYPVASKGDPPDPNQITIFDMMDDQAAA